MEDIKCCINKYTILLSLFLSSAIIAILYSLGNFNLFIGNFLVVLGTFIIQIVSVGLFILMSEKIIIPKKKFKNRFFQITKSILIAQMVMLPIACIILIIYPFFNIPIEMISKIIITATNYVVLLLVFFSYRFVTKSDNHTAAKVIFSAIILIMLIRSIYNFLI